MIEILIKKSDERILHVTVEGHAYYDKKGNDIVCAAVSALTIGIINSVKILLNIDLIPEENYRDGFISWDIPKVYDNTTDDRLQLLMKTLVESLLMIEEKYKKYIQIIIETS